MQRRATSIVIPLLLMTVGLGWLLMVMEADPRIHWIPVLGMAVVGLLTLALGGIDKVTICVGPFLLISTGIAVARQTGYLHIDFVLPCMVLLAGALMLIAHFAPVPYPKWLQAPHQATGSQQKPKRLRLQDQASEEFGEE